ncbi:MAG: phosphoribosylanthranilate isomerase [Candidatus Marinimicrobia bacterium]|nr:phosphoribosylanthranilate isomerase [Candidatus Neomarinimicrobiota bacterium]
MKNFIQIAGVHDLEEAKMIATCGVSAIGFPLRLPSHEIQPEISEEQAKLVITHLSQDISCVLITYINRASEILALCKYLNVHWVQVHGDITTTELKLLKPSDSSIKIIKSLVVGRYSLKGLLSQVGSFTPFVDAFITDTYDPESGAYGATGKTHDWNVSRQIVRVSSRPVILAGGLNPSNVCEAIQFVRPSGVDVHSGVEGPNGRKDLKLVKKFVQEARRAFALTESNQFTD